MNNLLRFIVMLFACLVSMAGYADANHDAEIYLSSYPSISSFETDVFIVHYK